MSLTLILISVTFSSSYKLMHLRSYESQIELDSIWAQSALSLQPVHSWVFSSQNDESRSWQCEF